MQSQRSPPFVDSLSESILHDCKILSNVLLIFNKSKKDGYFDSLMQNFQNIFRREMTFAISEILEANSPRRGLDLKSQLVNNIFIFKENLKTITRVLIDNIWEHRIQSNRLQEVISRAKLSLHRGRCEEILELQDEENCASSGKISNVSNALNLTLASKDKMIASLKPPEPLEDIPESLGIREEEDFDYSYGTEFESRDPRFGSVISRSVSFTRKEAGRKSELRGDQNYYETEDLDYTIDFDDDSKAGELLRSREGARSEQLCSREEANEVEHKSVSSKHLVKRKASMSMVDIGNVGFKFDRRPRHRKQDSLDLPEQRMRKIYSFEPKRETKPFLTWGKANAGEELKRLPQMRGSGLNTYMKIEEGHTSSDKSQTSFQDLRKKNGKRRKSGENEEGEKGGNEGKEQEKGETEKEGEEVQKEKKISKTKEIEKIKMEKPEPKKNDQGKLKTKIKRGLARKWIEKKFSFDKNRSHSPFKEKPKPSLPLITKNTTEHSKNSTMHNRSVSEQINLDPKKPSEPPLNSKNPSNKVIISKFRNKSKPEKKRKKTISPKQIMRGLMRVQRGPEPVAINSARKPKLVDSSGKIGTQGQLTMRGTRIGRSEAGMRKSQEASLGKIKKEQEMQVKSKRKKLRTMASQTSFRPLVSLRNSRTKFRKGGAYVARRVRKVPIFNFSKMSKRRRDNAEKKRRLWAK